MKAKVITVKHYWFTGATDSGTDIEGEFTVNWDDDIPVPEILYVQSTDKDPVEYSYDQIDYSDLEDQLVAFDTGAWAEDRAASLIDDVMDAMEGV